MSLQFMTSRLFIRRSSRKMSSLLICMLLSLAVLCNCTGGGDTTIDEIDQVNKELMKEDNDDDDGSGKTTTEEYNEHQYQRNMKHNVEKNGITEMHPNDKDSSHFGEDGDIERKIGKNGYNAKNMRRGTIKRRVYLKRNLYGGESSKRKLSSRRRGNGISWKTKGGKRPGYEGKGRKYGNNVRRYRKKKISNMKINTKSGLRGLRGNRNGEKMKRRRKGLRNQGHKGKGNRYVRRYGNVQNYNKYRKIKIRYKIGVIRQRRTRRLKSLRRHTGKGYSIKYGYNVEIRRNKKQKKRRRYSFKNRKYPQSNRSYRKNRKIQFCNRNGFRRKQKGRKKSRVRNRKGKTENSRCTLNKARIQMKLAKQFVSSLICNRFKYKQKLQGCRRPEWYDKKFGADIGFVKWMQCVKVQWKTIGITLGGYGRKIKFIKCGAQQYNPTVKLCCEGNLYKKLDNINCCGPYTYNVTSQFCWNNTKFDSAQYSICNLTVYDHAKQFCYNGSLYNKNGRYEICCKDLFDRTSQFCYHCKIYTRGCYRRCGNKIYCVKNQFCFHGCLFDRYLYDVCGGRVIKRSKHKCVDNAIKPSDQTKSSKFISRKREFQENNPQLERDRLGMIGKRGKRNMSPACQEMVYN